MSRRTLKIAVVSAALALSAGIGLSTATSGSAAVVPAVGVPHRAPAPQHPVPQLPAAAVVADQAVVAPGTAQAEPTSTDAPDPHSTIQEGTCAACVFPEV